MATLKWSPVLVRSSPVDESTPRSGLRETRFADLQRKYSRVLGAKTHGEYEANLGDKGVWFRVFVGSPGSREAASEVCTQLKMAWPPICCVRATFMEFSVCYVDCSGRGFSCSVLCAGVSQHAGREKHRRSPQRSLEAEAWVSFTHLG
jgi:hypothetical protein